MTRRAWYPPITDRRSTALSAIGQFDDTVTPLQEAMVAAAIANHGTLMRPYLVQQVQAPDLSTIQSRQPVRADASRSSRGGQRPRRR